MAEDVLRVAGFVEHVNYEKQTQAEGSRGIPDFTFRLPKGHVLYMDVKFPLTAYLRYLDATNEPERATARAAFVRDVEAKVRELADRGYADRSRRTLDQVLLFIPNESIAAVVHEWAPTLVDGALARNVVLCSPLTLFTMLGVIRQAADAFMVEQTSDEILRLVGAFDKQWQKFGDALDLLGKRIDSAQKAFEELNGTRRRQLERPVGQMEQLRAQRGLAADPLLSPGADVRELSEVRPA